MLDLLWILPNLNEKVSVIKLNLLKCFNYSEMKNYKSKIILSDGGSSVISLGVLKKFIQRLNSNSVSTQIMLCFPVMHPNKNLGILNIIEKYKSKHVVILDSDLLSLNKKCFDNLIGPLMDGKAKMTIPNIKRRSGRSNKLIINPLMRLFYPTISFQANFVLSGILGINYNLLRRIVTSPDYCWDWGGEIQIICGGFEHGRSSVKTFTHRRRDAKRRKLASKTKEARQLFRTLLYEVSKKQGLSERALERKLESSWVNNQLSVKNFLEWQKKKGVSIIPEFDSLKNYFYDSLERCRKNIKWFSFYLDEIYVKTQAYEILVLRGIVADTILKTLFGIRPDDGLREIGQAAIEKTDLDSISIFADVIFAVYVSLWAEQSKNRKKGFQYFLNLLSVEDTDFLDARRLNGLRDQGLRSIDIDDIKVNNLNNIIRFYNDATKSLFQKNKLLVKTIEACKK